MLWEKSCGAVVFTRIGKEIKYVLAQNFEGIYGFPKGHVEPGETEQETALREIFEEVHLKPTIIDDFRVISEYVLPNKKDVSKQVVFFLAEYENQEIVAQQEELSTAALVTFNEAMSLLQHETNRKILNNANNYLLGRK